jgi:Protein of unknown function (DUF1326)
MDWLGHSENQEVRTMKRFLTSVIAGLFILAGFAVSSRAAIQGDYVEVRSADVYTGPCFANSQVGLEGQQAILGWKVKRGSWNGVSLDGLGVVAVIKASATLGDPYHNPYPAESVLIVDQRATGEQRAALQAFAKSAGGKLLDHIVRVEAAAIEMTVGEGSEHGAVNLRAGKLAQIKTRSLCSADHLCGNEEVYYPPLTEVAHAMPGYALVDSFTGKGLGVVWNREGARSAFIGNFTL